MAGRTVHIGFDIVQPSFEDLAYSLSLVSCCSSSFSSLFVWVSLGLSIGIGYMVPVPFSAFLILDPTLILFHVLAIGFICRPSFRLFDFFRPCRFTDHHTFTYHERMNDLHPHMLV